MVLDLLSRVLGTYKSYNPIQASLLPFHYYLYPIVRVTIANQMGPGPSSAQTTFWAMNLERDSEIMMGYSIM